MPSENERLRILGMIENGELSPDEGARLLSGLTDEPSPPEDLSEQDAMQVLEKVERGELKPEQAADLLRASAGNESHPAPKGDAVEITAHAPHPHAEMPKLGRWRDWWMIPLWVGVAITLLSSYGMYAISQSSGTGFWFYVGLLFLLFGVGLTALAFASRDAPWLHVRVKQSPGEKPERISISFPIPIGLSTWFLRNFGHHIEGLNQTAVDEIILALENNLNSDQPLYIEVDESENGEQVQVFIG